MEATKKLSEILMLNKEDIQEALQDVLNYCTIPNHTSNYKDNNIFLKELNSEIKKFICEVEKTEFPPLSAPWSYYIDIRTACFSIGIGKVEERPLAISDFFIPSVYDDVLTEKSRFQGRRLSPKSNFLTHQIKMLTVEEYALQNNLSPVTVREYVRKNIISSGQKIGRLWYIPILTKKRDAKDEFYSAVYDYITTPTPTNIPLKYKYLDNENIKRVALFRDKLGENTKRFSKAALRIDYKNDFKSDIIKLSIKESKELESYLQSTPSFKYNSLLEYRLYVWEKMRIKLLAHASEAFTQEISGNLLVNTMTE